MPASQPAHFNLQEFSDVGQLLVGGRLYTYGYGTTAHKTAFTDPAGAVPHTYTLDGAGGQYIALNARGELPAPLYLGAGSYDIALKRADGSTVWTRKADGVENPVNSWIAALAAAQGASLVSFIGSGAGAIPRTLLDKLQELPSLKDFGAKSDGSNDTDAVQRALNYGGLIFAKAGTYNVSRLDFTGRSVVLIGDGEDKTVFHGIAATTMFDMQEAEDRTGLPLALTHLKLDGAGIATAGIKTRYRHKTLFSNVTVVNCNGDGLNELDSWNNQRTNLTLSDNVNGLVLQGANNNCLFSGLSISGNSGRQLDIQNGGTVGGGSAALSFYQSDFEYGAGDGVRIDTHGVVHFYGCYIGEQIQGKVFDMVSGMAIMDGGFAYFGTGPTSYLGNLQGGKLYLRNVNVTGGAAATVANMFYKEPTWTGHAYVEDSPCFVTVGGTQVMRGDVLDYGRTYECFAPKLGRKFVSSTLNGTNSATTTDDEITVTCTSVTGAPCVMDVSAPVNDAWRRNDPGSFVIVYKSNKPLTARLTNGPYGTTPDINIGTLPATGGEIKTAVVFSWVYFSDDGSQDMTTLEIFQLDAAVGDSFTVYEAFLYDFKQGKADAAATFYNLGKA